MGISFEEATQNDLVSTKTLEIIPNKCRCGAPLELSDSLRELKCVNKDCIYNIVDRLITFCNKTKLNIKDTELKELTLKLNIITPYQLLMLDEVYKNNIINKSDIQNIDEVMQSIKNIKEVDYFIYEIAEVCGIVSIEKVAYKLFNGFNSFEEAFEEIETGQVSFINERLGIKDSDSSILSIEVYNQIIKLKEELIFGETQLKIKEEEKERLNIAFTDNVSPFVNKSELMDKFNNKYNYQFTLITTVSENTDILIKNNIDSNTNKYRTASLINDKFIAESMNNGELLLNDIGKIVETQLKPLGSKIYIDTLENVTLRLDQYTKNKYKENQEREKI